MLIVFIVAAIILFVGIFIYTRPDNKVKRNKKVQNNPGTINNETKEYQIDEHSYVSLNDDQAVKPQLDELDKKITVRNLITYAILFFIYPGLVATLVQLFYILALHVDFGSLTPEELLPIENTINSLTQFITYITIFIVLVILSIKWIKEDIKTFKPIYILYGVLGLFALVAVSVLASLLFQLIGIQADSENQQALDQMLKSSPLNLILTGTTTVLFAPVVEELIFRKSIFKLNIQNEKKAIIISSLIFGGLHVLSGALVSFQDMLTGAGTIIDLLESLIYMIPYTLMGGVLAFVYSKSNHNIYASIIAHMLNNTLSLLLLFL